MKTFFLLLSALATVTAFNAPMMATRAVGKNAPKAKASKAPAAKAKAPAFSFGAKPKPAPAATKAVASKKSKAPKKVVAKKAAPTKKVAKKAAPTKKVAPKVKSSAPQSQGYPSFDFTTFKPFSKISGGGNRGPTFKPLDVPDFSDPKLQVKRDPAFYAAAAASRQQNLYGSDFVYEDGLTVIERKQQTTTPGALTGSAKIVADISAIDNSIEPATFFGLSGDRFQLLFISVFGLLTLVGCLSGRLTL